MVSNIAKRWRILSGENDWEGLLDPLDVDLRCYLILYGERVQALYDGIDDYNTADMHGYPRVPRENLFSEVGLEECSPYKYSVTDYLYATSEFEFPNDWVPNKSTWIGYVAVATDEGKQALGRRDILICWRGSLSAADWFKYVEPELTPASIIFGTGSRNDDNPKVHKGIYSVYTANDGKSKYNKRSAREQVVQAVKTQVNKYQYEEISITVAGHNVGGALATLNAVDIVRSVVNDYPDSEEKKPCLVTAFVFGSPKVGDKAFKDAYDEHKNLHLLRIIYDGDVVPNLPKGSDYVEMGIELKIDATLSPYLKTPPENAEQCYNNLEHYLYRVASNDGELVVPRDYSLLNKELDLLITKCNIPVKWWAPVKHKWMVQKDCHWIPYHYVPPAPDAE